MKKQESKYFYSAELMNQALLALLEKKDIEFISVTEIAKKAGVNRSTFYLHYDNIYELLEETIENLNKKFISSFCVNEAFQVRSKNEAFLLSDEMLYAYLNFVKENRRALQLIHKRPNLFHVQKTYQDMYERIFYPAISLFLSDENERIYNLEFFTGGIAAIIHKWLERDCVTEIETVVAIIKNCVGVTAKN